MLKLPTITKKQNKLSVTSLLEVTLCSLIALIPIFEENVYHEIQYVVSGITCICIILLIGSRFRIQDVGIPVLSVLFLLLLLKNVLSFGHRLDIGECETLICMFMLSLWLSIQNDTRVFHFLFIALSLQCLVQALLCILQAGGEMQSLNSDFKVAGTFLNPGPLGIFFVTPCIYLLHLCRHNRIKSVKSCPFVSTLSFSLLCVLGVVLSGSRTAFLSLLLSAVLYLKGFGSWKWGGCFY